METPTKRTSGPSSKLIVAVAAVIIVLLAAILAVLLTRPSTTNIDDEGVPKLGYATDAKVMLDQDSLQAAVDEALENAKNGMVALQYQNDAFSADGQTFSCYIANAPENLYDMFLTIYADADLTDQIFLSELVPPGSGFEEITLEHALDPGDHMVYVAVTQVETDDETGEQVMRNQVLHTIEFHVGK